MNIWTPKKSVNYIYQLSCSLALQALVILHVESYTKVMEQGWNESAKPGLATPNPLRLDVSGCCW